MRAREDSADFNTIERDGCARREAPGKVLANTGGTPRLDAGLVPWPAYAMTGRDPTLPDPLRRTYFAGPTSKVRGKQRLVPPTRLRGLVQTR